MGQDPGRGIFLPPLCNVVQKLIQGARVSCKRRPTSSVPADELCHHCDVESIPMANPLFLSSKPEPGCSEGATIFSLTHISD